MKNMILALALLVSTPAFAATELLSALQPFAGTYELVRNNPKNPCSNIDIGSLTRLAVFAQTEPNDFSAKGDTVVDLQQWFETSQKWGARFDRPYFASINKGTKRSFVPQMRMVVSHQTLWSSDRLELSHSATISTLQGRGEGVQMIQFNGTDSFEYTYVINERNVLGQLTKSTLENECEFSRTQSAD